MGCGGVFSERTHEVEGEDGERKGLRSPHWSSRSRRPLPLPGASGPRPRRRAVSASVPPPCATGARGAVRPHC